jgi:predicted transcriptional regulator of viral defense system
VVTRRVQRRRDLYRLASGQGGYFTAAQARELGYSYQAQAHHVRAGNWERVDRGLFRLPELPVDRHDDLIRASLWSRSRGVVSHESAAAVHELAEIDPLRVHLTVPRTFASASDAIVIHRDQLPATDVEDGAGFRVTTPLRTLVDLGRSGTDVDQLGRAITDGLDRHLVTLRALRRRAEEIDPAAALAVERALLEVSTT